ncbi:cadherin-like domain-containing protein, partial [Shewanella sp. 10N.261.52.F9]|uniref:Ig-like domain-containing protein n=1 Tax=Shewanella sp. 10N.261.52.F9 TaxID=3229684 RepID=UPI00354CBC45
PTFVKIHGDYPGVTTLDWQVLSDGESYASVALIDVDPQTVAVNVAPETTPLMLAVDSDEPVNINLGDAVHDSDGDELTITEFVQTDNRFQQDGFDVVYRASGFVGQEIAYYTVDDGQGGSTIGTVSITVSDANPVTPNTAPEASDIEKSLGQGERIQIDISPSVADVDGDEVQLHKLAATSGRATIIDPNTIEYNAAQFSGQDSFIYVVKDNKGGFAQAEVKLDVAAAEVILPLATQPLTLAMSQG